MEAWKLKKAHAACNTAETETGAGSWLPPSWDLLPRPNPPAEILQSLSRGASVSVPPDPPVAGLSFRLSYSCVPPLDLSPPQQFKTATGLCEEEEHPEFQPLGSLH